MENGEEGGTIDDQQIVRAGATKAEGKETAYYFSSMDVAGLEAIPVGETTNDWKARSIRCSVVLRASSEGANLRGVGATVGGVFAAVVYKDYIFI